MRMGMSGGRLGRRIAVSAVICVLLYILMIRLQPAFIELAHESANNIVTEEINKAVAESFKNRSTDLFCRTESGSYLSDVSEMNLLKSDILCALQTALSEDGGKTVAIPIGSASGFYLLNGMGPKIPVKISPSNTIKADFENTFESAGINFVKHTVYINISVTVNYRGFILNEQETITAKIPVMENVASDNVPSYYGSGIGVVHDR